MADGLGALSADSSADSRNWERSQTRTLAHTHTSVTYSRAENRNEDNAEFDFGPGCGRSTRHHVTAGRSAAGYTRHKHVLRTRNRRADPAAVGGSAACVAVSRDGSIRGAVLMTGSDGHWVTADSLTF